MKTRADFAHQLAQMTLSHVDRAVALLWYYRHTQEYEERSAAALATDLHDEGFPKPNVTRLATDLRRSRYTARGKRPATFQVDVRQLSDLNQTYLPLLGTKRVKVSGAILVGDALTGTRGYLEQLAHQINGAYDSGFFDACAVLCRRLMETLVIEVYIHRARHHEIQQNGVFVSLDRLLAHIKGDRAITLGRPTPKAMDDVKQLGDTAAHDRTYITPQVDIDDIKARYRRLIGELVVLAGIRK
jgi:hypothetical protein